MAGVIKLAIVGEATKFKEALNESEKGVEKFGKAVDAMKKVMLVGGAAAAAALTKGFLDGISAEASMAKVANSMGLTSEESERIGADAGSLFGKGWGESLAQVQQATGSVAQTLGDALRPGDDALKETTKNALALADTFEIDLNRAVNSAGILLSSGLAVDADHAMDLMTAALQKVPVQLREDLLDATDEYSKFFSSLGFSAEETMGMLVKASEDGMYGIDKTGDAIKEFGIRATDMSKATTDALDKVTYGAAADFQDAFAMGGDVAKAAFADVIDGLLAIEDPSEQATTAITLFGTPLEDLGVTEIPQFLSSLTDMQSTLGDVEGAADDVSGSLEDNLQQKLEGLKRRGFQALSELVMTKVVPVIEGLIPKFQAFGEKVQEVARWLMDHKEVLIGLAVGIGAIVLPIIVALIIQLGTLAVSWIVAFAPIVAVGVLIAGLVAGILWLYNNVEWFRTAVQVAINLVVGYFKVWWEMIKFYIDLVVGIIKTVVDAVIWVWQNVSGWIDKIVGFFSGLKDRIKGTMGGLADTISGPFKSAFNAIARLWNNTVGSLSFSVPSWVPGVGGKGWDVPNIPTFASGGFVDRPTFAIVGDTPPSQGGEHMVGDRKLRETIGEAVGRGLSIGQVNVGSVRDFRKLQTTLDWLLRTGGK